MGLLSQELWLLGGDVGIAYSESTILAARTLTRGSTKRGTLDISADNILRAEIRLAVGRSGTTALTNGVDVLVRRLYDSTIRHMSPILAVRTTVGASVGKTQVNGAMSVGDAAILVDSLTNFTAQDQVCFWGTATDPTTLSNDAAQADLEFCRVSNIVTALTLGLDAGVLIAKKDNEYVTDQAEHFSCWCPGGSIYEVIFDYGDDAAGDLVAIQALAHIQTLT